MPEQRSHIPRSTTLPGGWAARLGTASTADEVVRIASGFVASLSDSERAQLPAGCFPPPMEAREDVSEYAYILTHAQLTFDGPLGVGLLLDRLAYFFSLASIRLAQLSYLGRARL